MAMATIGEASTMSTAASFHNGTFIVPKTFRIHSRGFIGEVNPRRWPDRRSERSENEENILNSFVARTLLEEYLIWSENEFI